MYIDNILKPKSPEEIEDLERRGFRKNTGKWRFCIDISKLLDEYEKSRDLKIFKKSIIVLLKEKISDIYIYTREEKGNVFESIISEFESKNPTENDLDLVMEHLYNWADENGVWIEFGDRS